jgi:hypothetical protein
MYKYSENYLTVFYKYYIKIFNFGVCMLITLE